jgi:anti-anti-sigma regulatory factor
MSTALNALYAEREISITTDSIGANSRAFAHQVIGVFESGVRHVVIDCTQWRTLDFGLLSALVRCADFGRTRGGRFELVNLSNPIAADIRELRLERRLGMA